MILSKFKELQAVLPFNQIRYLSELDKDGEKELYPLLENVNKQVINTPDSIVSDDNSMVMMHYFLGGSDWYVVEYNRSTKYFFGYVVLNGDIESSEFGYFSFEELDQFNTFPKLINLDFFWKPISVDQLLVKIGKRKKKAESNQLIGDTYFKNNPSRILGEEVKKKRGDRGEDAFEIMVTGNSDSINKIEAPIVKAFLETDLDKNKQKALALAKAAALALEIELDL